MVERRGAVLKAELLERGFARVPGVLSPAEVERFRTVTDGLLTEHAERNRGYRAQGSMIPTTKHPAFADLVAHEGALALGDARLLHAAHANGDAARRTLITLWCQPAFASLPERVQAQLVRQVRKPGEGWPEGARRKLEAMFPTYAGDAEPFGRQLHRRQPEPA